MSRLGLPVYAIATAEAIAAIRYAVAGEWRLAIVWAGVAVSNFAFAGVK